MIKDAQKRRSEFEFFIRKEITSRLLYNIYINENLINAPQPLSDEFIERITEANPDINKHPNIIAEIKDYYLSLLGKITADPIAFRIPEYIYRTNSISRMILITNSI